MIGFLIGMILGGTFSMIFYACILINKDEQS